MDLQTTCAKCGADLSLDNMRALPNGKGFVCKGCYDVNGPRLTKSGFADVTPREQPLRDSSPQTNSFPEKSLGSPDSFFDLKEYVCHECGYSFKKNPEFVVKICPYCGKRETVHQKVENPAADLVD